MRVSLTLCAMSLTLCGHDEAVVPCSDANVQEILASNYDQSCKTDTDCVAVSEGNACYPCTLACQTAAINVNALPQYRADVAKTTGAQEHGGGTCNCLSLLSERQVSIGYAVLSPRMAKL